MNLTRDVCPRRRTGPIPLFERIKFLSITASNLDEFFMVRIASLTDMVHAGYTKKDIAGMTAREQLDALHASTKEFMKNQYQTLNSIPHPSACPERIEACETP